MTEKVSTSKTTTSMQTKKSATKKDTKKVPLTGTIDLEEKTAQETEHAV